MWVADFLTVTGLLLDVFGAVLLIGQDWRVTQAFAYSMNPAFRRLDDAIDAVWLRRQNIGPPDDGFDELVDAVIDKGLFRLSDDEIRCKIVIAPETRRGLAEFRLEADTDLPKQMSAPKIGAGTVHKLQQDHMRRWFVRRGVTILVAGFGLQIVATVLPYVACFVLVFFSWLVIPFPIPVPVPLPLPGSGVCSL